MNMLETDNYHYTILYLLNNCCNILSVTMGNTLPTHKAVKPFGFSTLKIENMSLKQFHNELEYNF